MEQTYKYDAFISYRHLEPDKPIAIRLQKLLEAYTPPKEVLEHSETKKLHLFRDETELPTSNDLGGDIRSALESSRYLVVICSPEFEKSKWCMEEVAYFKELHGGSTKNIITLLADDPDHRLSFPEALRFEPVTKTLESGESVTTLEEIEPLAANVSAKTQAQMLKRLKTEFLRVAALLYGCGYDDLYRREQRRRTKRILTGSLSAAAVFAIAALLSVAALVTISSQKKQIEENAAALQSSNEELLIRESGMLEKDGDLYGALEAVAQAFPETGSPRNGAIEQSVSLLGAYEPEIFTAVKKITLPAEPKELCMLNGGKTLAAKTNNGDLSLWNTETGEKIAAYSGLSDTAFYRNPRIKEASVTNIRKGMLETKDSGNVSLYTMYSKNVQEETQAGGENAAFVIDVDQKTVSRISPTDGAALWTAEGEDISFPFDYLSSAELLPVQTGSTYSPFAFNAETGGFDNIPATRALVLLDAATGAEKLRYDNEALKALIELDRYEVYPVDDYLIFTEEKDSTIACVVCRAAQTTPEVLFRTVLFDKASIGSVSFGVSGQTLCVSGFAFVGVMDDAVAFFRGYDLKSGKRLWTAEAETILSGDPMTGFIEPDKGAFNDFPVAFAVVGDRLFAANVQTGAALANQQLPGTAAQVCYSENGFVFITSENGLECFLTLRRMESQEKTHSLFLNREFHSEFSLAAYGSNVYAIAKADETDVILYRVIPNEARRTVYRRNDETDKAIYRVILSPDKTLAAFEQTDPEELLVVDTKTGEVRQTVSLEESLSEVRFFGNDRLAVRSYHSLQIVNLATGKAEREFSNDDYSLSSAVWAAERLILESSHNDTALKIEPGREPVELTLPEQCKLSGLLSVSPSGKYLLMKVYESKDGKSLYSLLIMDPDSGETVVCAAPDTLDPSRVYSSASVFWSSDETQVYLLNESVITGFSRADGSLLCETAAPSAKSLLFVGDSLCIVDESGYLGRMQLENKELTPLQRVKLADAFYCSTPWVCEQGQNGRAYLFSTESDGNYRYCVVFDPEKFEVVYRVDKCCGVDEERGVVYLRYYDCFDAYPMLDATQLKTLADERLGQ